MERNFNCWYHWYFFSSNRWAGYAKGYKEKRLLQVVVIKKHGL
jgi:hypothetical protein